MRTTGWVRPATRSGWPSSATRRATWSDWSATTRSTRAERPHSRIPAGVWQTGMSRRAVRRRSRPHSGVTTPVAVKIRLKRLGKIRSPHYRIVVADSRTKRDGRAIEEIGKYHPKNDPSLIEVNSERAQYWLSVGATAEGTPAEAEEAAEAGVAEARTSEA